MANKQEIKSAEFKKELKRFLKYKNRNWSPKTERNNIYYFDELLLFLKNESFSRENIENFFDYLKKKNLSESTRRQAETSILSFVKWLFYEEIINKNWASLIGRTKVNSVPRILPSQTEVIKLIIKATEPGKFDNVLTRFSKLEHRWCLLFIVTCSGTRNFETRSIKIKDVSISSKQILISEGKTGPRTISIAPITWLVNELERRTKGRTSKELHVLKDIKHYKEDYSDRLFVVNEKRLQEIMRAVGRLWGRPMNVHDLRRICLRDLKKNGAGVDDIKNVAGHKNIETTLKYLEFSTDDQEKTLKNFSTTARKFRTKEEKSKELVNSAWEIGRVVDQNFDGQFLSMKVKIN